MHLRNDASTTVDDDPVPRVECRHLAQPNISGSSYEDVLNRREVLWSIEPSDHGGAQVSRNWVAAPTRSVVRRACQIHSRVDDLVSETPWNLDHRQRQRVQVHQRASVIVSPDEHLPGAVPTPVDGHDTGTLRDQAIERSDGERSVGKETDLFDEHAGRDAEQCHRVTLRQWMGADHDGHSHPFQTPQYVSVWGGKCVASPEQSRDALRRWEALGVLDWRPLRPEVLAVRVEDGDPWNRLIS